MWEERSPSTDAAGLGSKEAEATAEEHDGTGGISRSMSTDPRRLLEWNDLGALEEIRKQAKQKFDEALRARDRCRELAGDDPAALQDLIGLGTSARLLHDLLVRALDERTRELTDEATRQR
jgi:hypothetical protein